MKEAAKPAESPFIIKTKLIPPKLGKNVLRRERLLRLLNENLDKRLVLVCADPGYGKTTLLAQWLDELPHPFVWYDLDGGDRDIAVFLTYIIEGLRLHHPDFGKLAESAILHTRNIPANMDTVAGTLINEIVDLMNEETFLILDGYDNLEECKPVNGVVDYLVSRLPENFHLIISGREEPDLSLAKLRAEGGTLEITRDDLGFTHREVVLLFRTVYRQKVTDERLGEITDRMRGWATGLQLYSQTERLPASGEPHRVFFDYFAQEILERQPPETKDFLRKTSILTRMSDEICNQVFGFRKSAKILQEIERKNLFIRRIEEESSFYMYHPVFRNFLQNALSSAHKDLPRKLHLGAASYFEGVGDFPEAINHYLEAKRYGAAIRTIERTFGDTMKAGRYDTLFHWLAEFPKEMLERNANLNLWMGEILFHWGDWDRALVNYKRAKWRLERAEKKKGLERANLGLARILTERGDHRRALKLGKRALSLIGKKDRRTKIQALQTLGATYFSNSQFQKAEENWGEALDLARAIEDRRSEATLVHNLGLVFAMRGELEKASPLYDTLAELRGYGTIPQMALAYCNSGRILQFRGDYDGAKKALDTALEISNLFNDRRAKTFALINMGELAIARGEFEEAEETFKDALSLNRDLGMPGANIAIYGHLSRLWLAEGKSSRAREQIHFALEEVHKFGDRVDREILNLIQGEIELADGNFKAAEPLFQKAASFFGKIGDRFHESVSSFRLAATYLKLAEPRRCLRHLTHSIGLCEQYKYNHFLTQELLREPSVLQFCLKEKLFLHYLDSLNLPEELATESPPSLEGPHLTVSLFGPLKVLSGDGTPLAERWRTQKIKSIFAYIFASPERSHSTEKLIDIFYPATELEKGKKNLYSAIFFIRQTLEPKRRKGERWEYLLYGSQGYYLNPSKQIWIDVEQFRKLVKEGDELFRKGEDERGIREYREAAALYKGDFVEELYDSWAEELRADLRNIYLKCLKRLADHHFQAAEYSTSLEHLRAIMEREPYQEEIYCKAMECLGMLKDRASIVELYEKLRKLLKEDLGLQPLPTTQRTYKSLIR